MHSSLTKLLTKMFFDNIKDNRIVEKCKNLDLEFTSCRICFVNKRQKTITFNLKV